MKKLCRHRSSLGLLACLALTIAPQSFQAQNRVASSAFVVLSRGQAVGSEVVSLTQSAEGWMVSSTETLGAPFDLTTDRFQARYTSDWRPLSLLVEGRQSDQQVRISTVIDGGTAQTDGVQRGQSIKAAQPVSDHAIFLPTGFYGAYEALAAQMHSAATGSTFRLFVVPIGEVTATVTRTLPHRLKTPNATIELHEFDLTIANPGGPLAVEIWTDTSGRLARVAVPASWFVMIREDISSPMTREESIGRAGDSEVFIPGLGFQLAATLSRPQNQAARGPAIVLIGGAGQQDRDERIGPVAVFGQLAGALADAGFLVVRYDKRGVGRSGGRTESLTLSDYADDALSVVKWLRERRDGDPQRIALVGYAEGGAAALVAATREKRVAAVCLIASAGQTGVEVTMQQQMHALSRANEPEEARDAKIALQQRVLDAVMKGGGWEGISPDLRRQAESAWFRSWLLYDPAAVMKKVKQPVLVVGAALDTQFPPAQSDRLESLGLARKNAVTQKVMVPGVNHLFVPAPTGEEDEYDMLTGATVSPAVAQAIGDWLNGIMKK